MTSITVLTENTPAKVALVVFEEEGNGLNLDGESIESLKSFTFYQGETEKAEGFELFSGLSVHDRRWAIKGCVKYAESKLGAMQARMDGQIGLALRYEEKCETIYNSLPKKARW